MMTRKRTERREAVRSAEKLSTQREKLFAVSDGGSMDLPIEVRSSSLVELRAESMPCPRCGGTLRTESHDAIYHGPITLRAARMKCFQCGTPRTIWFRVVTQVIN